jgi:hypothetical protein
MTICTEACKLRGKMYTQGVVPHTPLLHTPLPHTPQACLHHVSPFCSKFLSSMGIYDCFPLHVTPKLGPNSTVPPDNPTLTVKKRATANDSSSDSPDDAIKLSKDPASAEFFEGSTVGMKPST